MTSLTAWRSISRLDPTSGTLAHACALAASLSLSSLTFAQSNQPAKSSPQASAARQQAQVHYKASVIALQHNDLAVAENELQSAVKFVPGNATFWLHLTEVQSKRDEIDDALKSLTICKRLAIPQALRGQVTDLSAELEYKSQQTRRDQSLQRYLGIYAIPEWNRNGAPDAQDCPMDGFRHSYQLEIDTYDPQERVLKGHLGAHWSWTTGCGREDSRFMFCDGTWDLSLGMIKEENPDQLYLKGTNFHLTQGGKLVAEYCEFRNYNEVTAQGERDSTGDLILNRLPGFSGQNVRLSKEK